MRPRPLAPPLFRSGIFIQSALPSSYSCTFTFSPFAPRSLPASSLLWAVRLPQKKPIRGSPRFLGSSIPTRRLQPPRRVRWLLYPLLDHRCQASSASTDWPLLNKRLTRLNRVRLRCGSRVCLTRLRDADYSDSTRLCGYVDERVILTVNSFQFTRRARLALAHRSHQGGADGREARAR